MPTVLRANGYRFYFFSDEGGEPPHIHVAVGEKVAKFWLSPVELAMAKRMRAHEINTLRALVVRLEPGFLEAWHDHFDAGV